MIGITLNLLPTEFFTFALISLKSSHENCAKIKASGFLERKKTTLHLHFNSMLLLLIVVVGKSFLLIEVIYKSCVTLNKNNNNNKMAINIE